MWRRYFDFVLASIIAYAIMGLWFQDADWAVRQWAKALIFASGGYLIATRDSKCDSN